MKIAFLINQTHKEEVAFTTTLLAFEATKRGHRILYIGLGDFVYEDNMKVAAHVRTVPENYELSSLDSFLEEIRNSPKRHHSMDDIDVLWLRFDPVLDMISRPWAASMGLQFAQLIKRNGKLVINDPDQLTNASNKLYLEDFPERIQPQTIVTRSITDIENFCAQQIDKIILKPLKGSGGKNVFLINLNEKQNLKQTVEVIARDGYVIAQEYLPEATKGDLRFFLLDGQPILINGQYAAIQRVQQHGEIRSNIHQGARAEKAIITDEILNLVELVSPKLIQDNMYLVGLDIVGDKIMEINIFSPGALGLASKLNNINYAEYIIQHLERKVGLFYNK